TRMAYTSEIDKLERRHRDNPEGRTFAPLADAYRKAGDVPRALETLKAGLLLHPEYLSASIVLGRCHLDLGDLPSAETAFQRVLDLDKENVIAIKALADITERLSRFDESEHWLNYLLSIDSSNDDARVQLQRLAALREQAANMSMPDLPAAGDEPVSEPAWRDLRDEPGRDAPAGVAEDLAATAEIPPLPTEEGSFSHEEPEASVPRTSFEAMRDELSDEEPASPTEEVSAIRRTEPDTFSYQAASRTVESADDQTSEDDADLMVVKDERGESTTDALSSADDLGIEVEQENVELPEGLELDIGVSRHEEIVLRPSATSEFQVPSDADLLSGSRPSGSYSPPPDESREPNEAVDERAGLWQSHPEDATLEAAEEAPHPSDEYDASLMATEAWGAPAHEEQQPMHFIADDEGAETHQEEEFSVRSVSGARDSKDADELPTPDTSPAEAIGAADVDSAEKEESLPAAGATQSDPPEMTEAETAAVSAYQPSEDGHSSAVTSEKAVAEEPANMLMGEEAPEEEDAYEEEITSAHDTPLPVTETVGDVYAQQGHHAKALEVYRQLLIRSPGDSRLQGKISRSEDELGPEGKRGRFAASQTGGRSVRSYFGDLLATRLHGATNGGGDEPPVDLSEESEKATGFMEETFRTDADASVSGEPTRPASGPLSLSAIFGEDSSPVPPVVAGPDSPPQASAPASPFDEFFGERLPQSGSTTRIRSVRADADQDDLDQFHKWLKGLKR
ncbi:MAG: tetratricopeptide repeat protein, partial [Gemmatimonadota bacterium]